MVCAAFNTPQQPFNPVNTLRRTEPCDEPPAPKRGLRRLKPRCQPFGGVNVPRRGCVLSAIISSRVAVTPEE